MSPAKASAPAGAVPAFDAVYDEHFAFVWRSVRRLGVADASVDDVVQDVFLAVHRRLDGFEARSSMKTWLFGIALGVVRNHRRGVRRKRAALPEPLDAVDVEAVDRPSDPGPHGAAVRADAVRVLYAILDELDDDKRDVFVMAELEQLAGPEIAEALGVNVNTVSSRLRAARSEFEQAVARHRARDEWRSR